MLYLIIGVLFVLVDQYLKFWTVAHIELNAFPGRELIPGVLNMTYIKNAGAAFGLFSKFSALRWILLGLLIAFTLFIVLGIARGFLRTGFARWTGTLLLAGLLGNGVDRAIYGFVVDMFEPKLGSITWPIFNLADCLVVVFGILFCIAVLTGGIGAPDDEDEDEDEDEEIEERPRRRVRRDDEEEAPRRRVRRSEEDEAPRRRVRRSEEDEAPRRRVHRSEEEEAPRRTRPARDAQAAPARPRRVHTEDTVTEAPARRSAPKVEAPAAQVPENEATVTTVSRPVPAPKAEVRPVAAAPKAEARPVAAAPKAEIKPAPAASKTDSDEFDLDSILAEFK